VAYPAPPLQQQEDRRRPGRSTPKGVIIRVDTESVERSLFQQIAKQLLEPYRPEDYEQRLERIPLEVSKLVELIMKYYVSTPLGGQILDPVHSIDIIIDRIIQFVEILFTVQREYIHEIKSKIKNRTISREEVEDLVRRLLQNYKIIFITTRELMNRLYVLLQINAPAKIRPPLANVKIGYDVIQ